MKANEFMQIFELGKTFTTKEKKSSKTKETDLTQLLLALLMKEDNSTVTTLLNKKLEEANTLKKLMDDYGKANKKEDKKPDSGASIATMATFLVLTFPFTAPLYVHYLRAMLP